MTNFNHDAIATKIAKQVEQILIEGDFTNNEAIATRIMIAMEFVDAQINYLTKQEAEVWEGIIALYELALEPLKNFGRIIYNTDGGAETLNKGRKLAMAAVKQMANDLEGGNAGDLDCVWRQVVQLELFAFHKQMKLSVGDEVAEMVVEANNALTFAVNMELEVANNLQAA